MAIEDWSTTAASNNSNAPDGAPEGWKPSEVNATVRENMAQVRSFRDTMEWRDWGHVYTYVSATQFSTGASLDTTGIYLADRRVRAVGSTTGTIYGTVTSSSGTNPTTVVVVWDSGSLQSETLTISCGLTPTGTPLTGSVPSGGIIMWSGAVAAIPGGWFLCDGNNGTPNLQDRFIVGAGSTYSPDATGGSATAALPSHTHGVSGTTATGSANHTHAATSGSFSITGGATFAYGGAGASLGTSGATGASGAAHTHTFSVTSAAAGVTPTNLNLPPYYALAYIMKS